MNRGTILVLTLVGAALTIAGVSVWINHQQMQHVLVAYSPRNVDLIINAPQAELMKLEPAASSPKGNASTVRLQDQNYLVVAHQDGNLSSEFSKVRNWFVRDNNFDWSTVDDNSTGDWQYMVLFSNGPLHFQLVFDFHHQLMMMPDESTISMRPMSDSLKKFFETTFPADRPPEP